MSQRRMLSMEIVDSDAFLDMGIGSQLLYFHLVMRADDDGFVGNPKKIMRIVGSNEDDLRLLIVKRFLLSFENGIIVIKHWLMQNRIAKDRYHETKYTDEKNRLIIKENGAYTECIQNVYKVSSQSSLVKSSLVKSSNTCSLPFIKFWELYPRKDNKKKAEDKWKTLSTETQEKILEDIPKRKESANWLDQGGKFIPMPTTYLNGERWNDEILVQKELISVIDFTK